MLTRLYYLLAFILFSNVLSAQDLDSLLNIRAFTEESDLQKILNQNVSVSTQKLTTRETPGILSLITAEEIQNSGARDLIDVLRMVPGFDVMQDNQFVMGFALRGNWANEGKVLLMVDGLPFNDLLYQSVAVGNRFAVDAIERIEIIRGPGSAIYGGSAEYGVINIITKAAESLDGVAVYGTGGLNTDAIGRTNGGIMASQKKEDFVWDISLFKGKGIVSDQFFGESDLAKHSSAEPTNISAGLRYKGLSIRTMYDAFETADPTLFASFKTFFADVQYASKINDKLTLTPQFRYINQVPWQYGDVETGEDFFKVKATRSQAQLNGLYTFSRKANVTFGALYFHDQGIDILNESEFDGEKTINLNNVAFFAQGLFKHRLANATVGFRYEKNNRYGAAFVPRLALTKKIENFHFKILYSQAFRAPSIQNINKALTGTAKPEKSNVVELELGYQFTPEMLLAFNAFSITTKDVLIYGLEGEDEWYENFEKSGSNGFELLYSIRKKKWYANLTYSFSKTISGNTVDTYQIQLSDKQYVGLPLHKVTFNTNINITPKFSVDPSFIYASKRYAYTSFDEEDNAVAGELDPYMLMNLFLNYRNVFPGFTLGVGAYDLLNERPAIPQAYKGDYLPIPGRSREIVAKLSYQLNFKK